MSGEVIDFRPRTPMFSPEVLAHAKAALLTEAVTPDPDHPEVVFWVRASDGSVQYRVQLDDPVKPTWASCTCPHGSTRGFGQPSCYHLAAVLLRKQQEGETAK